MTQFFVPLRNPPTTTHQQKQVTVKNGKPFFYEPEALEQARHLLTAHLGKHIPDKPFKGKALQCTVKWFFPTEAKKYTDGQYRKTKPDTHNLNKLLFDVMTDLNFWEDDALVASELIQKFWVKVSPPGIFIKIEELE
ncbi:RusA family crossover junction endodeoxyribonuclease [Marinilactibacillus sp. GCM10026970]|uniref:RusA family crossover junction endodeoxyribonuclease n=1 Tax=Marinilactibacillus sp. GCM10026970 TaxID=3252642 RepID=UPI003606917D